MGEAPWWLDDGEDLHAAAPRTFFIPPRELREGLSAGDQVKLVFAFEPRETERGVWNAERMWVDVAGRRPDGRYTGTLANVPCALTELAHGDQVVFGPEHVVAYAYEPGELGYRADEEARIARCVRTDDRPPDVVRRRWRRWTATLAGEPAEDTMTLGDLTDRWPGLAEAFRAGKGTWRREPDTVVWRRP
jgi:hypothetical protein